MIAVRKVKSLHSRRMARIARIRTVHGHDPTGAPINFDNEEDALVAGLYLMQPCERGGIGTLPPPSYVFGGDNTPEHFATFIAQVQSHPRTQARESRVLWRAFSFFLARFLSETAPASLEAMALAGCNLVSAPGRRRSSSLQA